MTQIVSISCLQFLKELLDASIRRGFLAFLVWLGLRAFGVKTTSIRHAVWTARLLGMLLMPLLMASVPRMALPVPVLAAAPQGLSDGLSNGTATKRMQGVDLRRDGLSMHKPYWSLLAVRTSGS